MPKLKPVKKFVVAEHCWMRGMKTPDGNHCFSPTLANHSGNMCCMGHLGKACGYTQYDMEGIPFLDRRGGYDFLPAPLPGLTKKISRQIARINDSKRLTDPQRKAQLRRAFKSIGITVTFKP